MTNILSTVLAQGAWLVIVGCGIGWMVTRGAQLSVEMGLMLKRALLVIALVAGVSALTGWQTGFQISTLSFGIVFLVALKVWRLSLVMPKQLKQRGGRGGAVQDVFGDGKIWTVLHPDGSSVSYEAGRPILMSFRDGSEVDLVESRTGSKALFACDRLM